MDGRFNTLEMLLTQFLQSANNGNPPGSSGGVGSKNHPRGEKDIAAVPVLERPEEMPSTSTRNPSTLHIHPVLPVRMEGDTILRKRHCEKILERYTKSTECKIISVNIKPHKSQIDGFITDQYTLELRYENNKKEDIAKFFFKIMNGLNPVLFEISKEIKAYEKEAFFYETVVDLLQSKGLSCDFMPKSYLCYPYVVVLEDLSMSLYKMTTKNQPLDLDHCRKGLEILAILHTKSIIYEHLKTKEIGKSFKWTDKYGDILLDKIIYDGENLVSKYMKCSLKGLFQLIDVIFNDSDQKEAFKEIFEKSVTESFAPRNNEEMSTLLHGDLWSNNFLFLYSDDCKVNDCKLIDFQLLKYGPPANDVLQFIHTNTRKLFRDTYENELLSFYYKAFSNLLKEADLNPNDILSEVKFRKSCGDCKLYVKLFIVLDRGVTFISNEDLSEASLNTESFSKYLFEDRGKYLLRAFETNPLFKSVIVEELTELREMLTVK